jgi:hypothetical protein
MGGRAPGRLRPISSARQTSHQRVSILCVRKPPKPPEFRQTAGGGASHLNGACRIRDESFGQSSVEQEAADALEPRGGSLPVASPRELLNGTLTDAYRVANPRFRGTSGFAQAVH